MRDQTASLCDVSCAGSADDFAAWTSALYLRSAILFESRTTELGFHRTALHVARSGLDHYHTMICLRGTSRIAIGSREMSLSAGDIGILDMALPSRTLIAPANGAGHAHHVTLTLPRALLGPLLAAPDAVGCQRIRGDTAYGRILRGAILGLRQSGRELDNAETEPVTRAIATLVAGAVRPAPDLAPRLARLETVAKREAIKRALDQPRYASGDLDVEALCRAFAISRATLYRTFEPEGGLVHYVRQCQLRRALAALTSPAHGHRRILDIALQHGFRTESGFIRAFRRAFGVTPAEARAGRAPRILASARPDPAVGPAGRRRDAVGWLLSLGDVAAADTPVPPQARRSD